MRPTLVALDLDGTLLTHDCALPEAHRRAMHGLRRVGVRVCIVTGRPLATALGPWRALGLPEPLVCFNGGWVGRPGEPAWHLAPLAEAEVREALEALRDLDAVRCAYPAPMEWIMDREIEHTRAWRAFYGLEIPVQPGRFADWRGPSCKLMVVAPPPRIPGILEEMHRRLGARFQIARSQDDRIELMPRGVTKATGLALLAARLGVDRADVWAVGDAENDREMIAWAGHGCVMGQAPDRLRAIARQVLPGIHARGLAALPLLMGLPAGA